MSLYGFWFSFCMAFAVSFSILQALDGRENAEGKQLHKRGVWPKRAEMVFIVLLIFICSSMADQINIFSFFVLVALSALTLPGCQAGLKACIALAFVVVFFCFVTMGFVQQKAALHQGAVAMIVGSGLGSLLGLGMNLLGIRRGV